MKFRAISPGDASVGIEPEEATVELETVDAQGLGCIMILLQAVFAEIFDNIDTYVVLEDEGNVLVLE